MWYCHQLDRRIADHSLEHLFIECKKHFWLLLLSCLWVLAAAWGMNRPFHVRPQTSNLNDFFLAGHRSPDNSQRQRTKWERHRVLHLENYIQLYINYATQPYKHVFRTVFCTCFASFLTNSKYPNRCQNSSKGIAISFCIRSDIGIEISFNILISNRMSRYLIFCWDRLPCQCPFGKGENCWCFFFWVENSKND